MKKSVLALSISTAIGTFGMVGSALAITDLGVLTTTGTATQMKVNNSGIGHNLVVPYYTAQGANATLLTLTNTDRVNGKAVKIRFRGAENSDDVKDFQVFLSPGDIWTAMINQSATGEAQIQTNDKSCTKPAFVAGVPSKFGTERLSATTNVAGTREGYVEIFNMGDIAPVAAPSIYASTLHAQPAGTPTCTGARFVGLDTDQAGVAGLLVAGGLVLPTTGLTAGWTIINTTTGAAYGGNAVALQALNAAGLPATGNLVYWPQSTALVVGETRGYTADPLLAGNLNALPAVVPPIKALMQDLPDMSTPYVGIAATGLNFAGGAAAFNVVGNYLAADEQWAATQQAYELTKALAVTSVNNEFYSDSASVAIGAATDWVFSMPTRRYSVAYDYAAGARAFTDYTLAANAVTAVPTGVARNLNYFSVANTVVQGTTICVDGITPSAINREEGTNGSVAFSPSASPVFCGETGVWGVNQTLATGASSAVLGGAVTAKGITFAPISISEGWMTVATPGLGGRGLPVMGGSFTKAASSASTNYGINTDHRYTRVGTYVY